MTVSSLRPDGTISGGGNTPVGARTTYGALSDNLDSSYVEFLGIEELSLTNFSLPSGAVIKGASVRVRAALADGPAYLGLILNVPALGLAIEAVPFVSWSSPTTFTVSSLAIDYARTPFTAANLDTATLQFPVISSPPFSPPLVYEAYLDVTYVSKPVVRVSDLPATITDTNRPTISWADTLDSDGGAQTAYAVRVFTAAQYGARGFDPATSTPTASFDGTGSATSWQIADTLADNTYRAYVRVAQTVSGVALWSDYAFEQFDLLVDVPPNPTLVVTPVDESARNTLAMTAPEEGRTSLITNPRAGAAATTGWTNTSLRSLAAATLGSGGAPAAGGGMPVEVTTGFALVGDASDDKLSIGVALTNGRTYTLSAWIQATALTATNIGLRVLKPDGVTQIGTEATLTRTGTWTRMSVTFTADSTGTFTVLTRQNGAGAATWYLTGVMVEAASTVGAYFDGSMHQYTWTGTAHASTSVAVSSTTFEIQYSYDAGASWSSLRTVEGSGLVTAVAAAATMWDFESGNTVEALYRVRALHAYTAGYGASDWVQGRGTWTAPGVWWLKHPLRPDLSMIVVPRSQPTIERPARRGVFQALGASRPVVVTDTRSAASGTIVFRLDTVEEQAGLDALLAIDGVLLLQAPPDAFWDDRYLTLGDLGRARLIDKSWSEQTSDTLPWNEVARPAGTLLSVPA